MVHIIEFINSVMQFCDDSQVHDVAFDSTFLMPDNAEDKLGIVDVLCTDHRGPRFIIEMQVLRQDFFMQRALFYLFHVYTQQIKSGESYIKARPVYLIAILDFEIPDMDDIKETITLKNQHNKVVTSLLNMTFVSLPKFKKVRVEQLQNADVFERWCYILKQSELTEEDAMKLLKLDPYDGKLELDPRTVGGILRCTTTEVFCELV